MADIFERAVSDTGKPYLDAESQLLAAGNAAAPVLKSNLGSPDVIVRLVSATILAWIGGQGPRYRAALEYLDNLPRRLARTPVSNPSPVGVVSYLDQHFGAELSDLLALRLLKEPDWPAWKRNSALLYLSKHPNASVTGPLIRFVSLATDPEQTELALQAIAEAKDKDLQAKLRAEEVWLKSQGRALPAPLRALQIRP